MRIEKRNVSGLLLALLLVTGFQAAAQSQPAAQVNHEVESAEIRRGVGINFGIGTAAPTLDFDFRPFYGFAGGSLLVPLLSNGILGAFVVALGASFQLSPTSRWQLDIFGHASPGWWTWMGSGAVVGIGLGFGFRYTWESGINIAFRIPSLGFAIGPGVSNTATSVGVYYAFAYMSMPVFSLGYRF
jgi:hypothetical protein